MFSCEFCEIFSNIFFFYRTPAAFDCRLSSYCCFYWSSNNKIEDTSKHECSTNEGLLNSHITWFLCQVDIFGLRWLSNGADRVDYVSQLQQSYFRKKNFFFFKRFISNSDASFVNPNKAGIFEGSFSWGEVNFTPIHISRRIYLISL